MFRFSFYIGLICFAFSFEGLTIRIINPFKPGSSLVNINGKVKTLTRSTSCNARRWDNNQESACMCCIVKQGIRPKGQFKYSGNFVEHCLQKKHCTEDSLNAIAASWGTRYNPDAPELIVPVIIDAARVISTAGTLGKEDHGTSSLSPDGVIKALGILAAQNKIPGTSKEIKECYTAVSKTDKGSQTIQTYLVSRNTYCDDPKDRERGFKIFDGLYYVKELGKGEKEIKNTTRVKESVLGQYNLANPNRPKGFPAIALDEVSFFYKDHRGKTHYLAVLTLSPGQSIFHILKNFSETYKANQDGTLTDPQAYGKALTIARHAMASLGGQVGRLHATYMTRDKKGRLTGMSKAVHGDMHSNNIFENEQLDVVFIDAETFAIALKAPRSVGKDLLRMYLFSTIRTASHQNVRKGNVGQTYWHEQIIKPFLMEYILSYTFLDGRYSEENFKDVMRILRRTFSLSGAGGDPEAVFFRAGLISSVHAYKKYISPLLKEIEETIKNHPNPIELSLQGSHLTPKRMSRPWQDPRNRMFG
ncbi:MAG: hypothetical protein A2977_03670 [Alphaproteobacteria bacterium RIFCSPLOWO2_01_FULL_45_8]|nr:MAG: hypothetical protein A2977_03670 [Alphaproteobacteria bacterium RIFCSPLOWO2_01_FULL_45_8]